MNNAEKFREVFGLYATELWSMPEGVFLAWLNRDVETTQTDHIAESGRMTREEAKEFLFNMFNLIGTTAVEYWTEKDAEKMRQAVLTVENESTHPERKRGKVDDLIERQAALNEITGCETFYIGNLPPMIDKAEAGARISILPSAQKRGEWEEIEVKPVRSTGIYEVQSAKCSVCGRYHTKPYLYFFDFDNYCPHCGARMEDSNGNSRDD